MGENSKIEWTTHTFNPWWGCVKVSEACKHCYAESWARRVGQDVWGISADRRVFGDSHWKQPLQWNRSAEEAVSRPRVFCASMADVFEERDDLNPLRAKLWELIDATPNLDWLLLTKRPQAIKRLAGWGEVWPRNVWLGTTVELQKRADEALPYLKDIPAKIRFISAEPLLGPLDLRPWLGTTIDWVITGGESGPKARPASPVWFRDLMLQCMENEVAFHFKQWGDWAPGNAVNLAAVKKARIASASDGTQMLRVGKKLAGRLLDGEQWDGLPMVKVG
jgi:protein gp37